MKFEHFAFACPPLLFVQRTQYYDFLTLTFISIGSWLGLGDLN